MQKFTVLALCADATGKVKAKEAPSATVRLGVATVSCDVAATLGVCLGKIAVFAITARPFIVPDIEDCPGLRRGLGIREVVGVHLDSGRSSLLADDLANNLLLRRRRNLVACRRNSHDLVILLGDRSRRSFDHLFSHYCASLGMTRNMSAFSSQKSVAFEERQGTNVKVDLDFSGSNREGGEENRSELTPRQV